MDNLIESILAYKQRRKLNDRQFSKLLSVDPSTWSKIKKGDRKPGSKFFKGLAHIPELQKALNNYMLGDMALLIIHGSRQANQNSKWGAFRGFCDKLYQRLLNKVYEWATR